MKLVVIFDIMNTKALLYVSFSKLKFYSFIFKSFMYLVIN